MTNKPSFVRNVYTPGKPADARTCPKNAYAIFTNKPFSLFIIAVALMVPVCKRDAAKGNTFGLHCVLEYGGFATVFYRTNIGYYLKTLRARGRAVIIKPLIQTVFVFKTMPCLFLPQFEAR